MVDSSVPGCKKQETAIGKEMVAKMDPSETHLVRITVMRKIPMAMGATLQSIITVSVPPDKIPFPPRKLKNTGKVCPKTTNNPAIYVASR